MPVSAPVSSACLSSSTGLLESRTEMGTMMFTLACKYAPRSRMQKAFGFIDGWKETGFKDGIGGGAIAQQ